MTLHILQTLYSETEKQIQQHTTQTFYITGRDRILLTSNISIKISIKFQQRYFLSSCRKPLQRMGAAQNDCKEKRRAESLTVAKITCRNKKSTLSMQILKEQQQQHWAIITRPGSVQNPRWSSWEGITS